MKFETIGFIGLGLIGGSIAKKIKQNNPNVTIYATTSNEVTIKKAYQDGLIANSNPLPLKDFKKCDHIFLCAPVQRNIDYLCQLKDIICKDCYITDVGSTKTEIHEKVIELGLENNFIGGHPMTGSEKTGITNANEYLLENAYYIITPTATTPQSVINEFRDFILSLGAIPLILDYKTHDYSTASISHLPHMIAYTLVNLVKEADDEKETMKTIAAGGFRDITRIASSSPIMWQNICLSNRKPLLQLMDLYIKKLTELRYYIDDNNLQAMLDFFQSAKDYRDSISIPSRKAVSAVYEIYLDLIDEAGGIATIATILAGKGVNIKNIGIINNREFEEGVLRIEFYDEKARDLSIQLLTDKNYMIHKR